MKDREMHKKSIKIHDISKYVMQQESFSPSSSRERRSTVRTSQRLEVKRTKNVRRDYFEVSEFETFCVFTSTGSLSHPSHPFVDAGAAQAAKEPVDHLNGAEDQLQTARGQQSSKQSNVELHHVFRLRALPPPGVIGQVTGVTVQRRRRRRRK